MKLTEFIEATKRYQKQMAIIVWVAMAIMMAAIFICAPLQPVILRHLPPKMDKDEARLIAASPLILVAMLFIFGLAGGMLYAQRKAGMFCRECKKEIGRLWPVVVASKCCPHCGKRIIEEDAPEA
jgi:hypothetical protein